MPSPDQDDIASVKQDRGDSTIAPARSASLNASHQSKRLKMVLMTAVIYGVSLLLLAFGVANGIFDAFLASVLGGLCIATATTFYVIVRSNFNLRFSEPSLAFPQAIAAQTLIALAYAATGPAHGGTLILLAMVMFFGMFDMSVRHVRILVAYTVALLAGVMSVCSFSDPVTYPPLLQLIYFTLMAAALPAISLLSVQLSTMRSRLRSQKVELEVALNDVRRVATHDELTGLPNRRHMLALLAEHVARYGRGGQSFSVALVDIDHFKAVNDKHGHRTGDEALVCFAMLARKSLRSTDIVARWGGEEFLMLLPELPEGDPALGIERLRTELARTAASKQAPQLRVAFSAGMTRYRRGEELDDLVERADRALYAAKSDGRNRTVTLDGPP